MTQDQTPGTNAAAHASTNGTDGMAPTPSRSNAAPSPGSGPSDMGPISVSAPRSAMAAPTSAGGPARLSELVALAKPLLEALEKAIPSAREQCSEAKNRAGELDERLRLGVRMLQAFDVQVERCNKATAAARTVTEQPATTTTSTPSTTIADDAAESRIASALSDLDTQIAWRLEGANEAVAAIESRIEKAVEGKLAWLDGELGSRLERIGQSVAAAEKAGETLADQLSAAGERITSIQAALDGLQSSEALVTRAERANEAVSRLGADAERHIEALAARTGDAGALREALGTLLHQLTAAREGAQGELRKLHDDLGWMLEKAERIQGDLVEKADDADRRAKGLAESIEAINPAIGKVDEIRALLDGNSRSLAPVTTSIAAGVRRSLRSEMQGLASALRELATRAEHSFEPVEDGNASTEITTEISSDLAREVNRVAGPAPAQTISVNAPIELDA